MTATSNSPDTLGSRFTFSRRRDLYDHIPQVFHIGIQRPIVAVKRNTRTNGSVDAIRSWCSSALRNKEIVRLCPRHEFNREDIFGIVEDREQFAGGCRRMRKKIFLQTRCQAAIERCRSGKPPVVVAECSSGILRNHEARMAAGIARQERRQPAHQRIDKTIHPPLAHRGYLRDRDRQTIGRLTKRRRNGMGFRGDYRLLGRARNRRIVRYRRQFLVDDAGGLLEDVPGSAMGVRHRPQAQCILRPPAKGCGNEAATPETAAQPGTDLGDTRRGAECEHGLIEGRHLATGGFQRQRGDGVGPIEQALGAVDGKRRQSRGASRAVDEAEPLLGAKHQGAKADRGKSLRAGHRLPLHNSPSLADQNERGMGVVGQIAGRALGGHFGDAIMLEKRRKMPDNLRPHAGMTMGEIGNLRRDDGAHFARRQQGTNAAGVAHDDIARKTALRGAVNNGIGQGADACVDAIGTHARLDDALDDSARLADTLPGSFGQAERLADADACDLAPG
ncbi:N-methyltryptophan oxidase, sarcosine oxidase [Rhizobium freirei PRF 81]|uniref:N-methyltryptophan oxidase, sarcosine oxidase n=1 Tax=Rhizobium freirei PRF 81 TaxID=363754 RepID=N6TXH8_9HYPH|nr:N-methyltryptophan oxidase, sarcosine oxidase [Rhizobium freirei PRF 81]